MFMFILLLGHCIVITFENDIYIAADVLFTHRIVIRFENDLHVVTSAQKRRIFSGLFIYLLVSFMSVNSLCQNVLPGFPPNFHQMLLIGKGRTE